MSAILRIRENYNRFTKTDKKVADFFLENPDKAVLLSAKELGELTNTSASAVIRFIKKINYDSMTEIRIEMTKSAVETNKEKHSLLIEADDSPEMLTSKISSIINEVTGKTIKLINFRALDEGIKKLRSAECIYLYGIGASSLAASDIYVKLLRINRKVVFHNDSNTQMVTAVNTTEKDAVIAFSYAGQTKEVIYAVEKAKENGAYCISVTSLKPDNHLPAISDLVLYLPDVEPEVRLGAIGSRYAQLIIADILFMGIAQENFDLMERYLLETREMVNRLRGS
jgi:DNA-binding MurR/RpiR family transcriptional regulator